jgi:uncharacterized protein YdhG (YjbR/CyaY superfamily)
MNIASVDAYIAQFQGTTKERLEQMRQIVHETAPQATESIAYMMPAYKIDGKPLVYFAGYPHHIGLYATPNGHEAFSKEFSYYKQGKGSVQFPHDQELPVALVRRVVEYRLSDYNS